MKAVTISRIYDLLKRREESTRRAYETKLNGLRAKYESDWLETKATEAERKELSELKTACNEAYELFKDYSEHEW